MEYKEKCQNLERQMNEQGHLVEMSQIALTEVEKEHTLDLETALSKLEEEQTRYAMHCICVYTLSPLAKTPPQWG